MFFFKLMDRTIGPYLPGWFTTLFVSSIFGVGATFFLMTMPVLVMLDPTWYWSITSRVVFCIITLIFCGILINAGSNNVSK